MLDGRTATDSTVDGRRWTRETPTVSNPWLAPAFVTSFLHQLAVLYTPLRRYFGTVPLGLADWALLGLVVLLGGSAYLLVGRAVGRRSAGRGTDAPATGNGESAETPLDRIHSWSRSVARPGVVTRPVPAGLPASTGASDPYPDDSCTYRFSAPRSIAPDGRSGRSSTK